MPPPSEIVPERPSLVAIGLGSSKPHGRYGRPPAILHAATTELKRNGLHVLRMSPIITTPPLGHRGRSFANAALIGEWQGSARALLSTLKKIEQDFGRRPGKRWGPRVLDLDILLIDQQQIRERGLNIPHKSMASRDFVLQPLAAILPSWRHPGTGLSVRQMLARLQRPKAVRASR